MILLCILDGYGISYEINGNAVKLAKKPFIDYLFNKYPSSKLEASGKLVGLPYGQMGNSEVGHSNIGAGRIVYQSIEKINNKIENEEFYNNENLIKTINYVKNNNKKLHLTALISDGGVHSSLAHIKSIIKMCQKHEVFINLHVITDGRDTLPTSSLKYIDAINDYLKGNGVIASISGRYYAMDRDDRYERIKLAYDAMCGISNKHYTSYQEAISSNYKEGVTDEFITPGIIDINGCIDNEDALIFANFRPDRIRCLGNSLTNSDFDKFIKDKEVVVKMLTLMPVSNEVNCTNMYQYDNLNNTLGEVLANNNLKQLRIAETEKYAHVTYFMDGLKELELKNCDRILIKSPAVATYDLTPAMSAPEITTEVINKMNYYDVVILNFANGDMVGHTGKLNKAIEAIEVLDSCLEKIYLKLKEINGTLILTADHGNCEQMLDSNNNVLTSHSTNLVPFLINKDLKLKDGKLSDIAPTILSLLNIDIPTEMTGDILIEEI